MGSNRWCVCAHEERKVCTHTHVRTERINRYANAPQYYRSNTVSGIITVVVPAMMGVLFAALTSELAEASESAALILATIGAPVFKFIVESAEFRVASLSPGELRGREAHALFRSIRLGHWALAAACLIKQCHSDGAGPSSDPVTDNICREFGVRSMLAIDLSFDAQADPRLAWRYYRSNTTSGRFPSPSQP